MTAVAMLDGCSNGAAGSAPDAAAPGGAAPDAAGANDAAADATQTGAPPVSAGDAGSPPDATVSGDAGPQVDASGPGDGAAGSGTACSGEAVPAGAAAAGFTECARDYDFSQPLYSKESSWLDWNNTNPSVAWHNGWPGGTSHFPDGNVFQTKDPESGQTVVDLKWSSSFDGQQTGNNAFVSIATIMDNGEHAVTFPNFYAESVYRIDDVSADAQGNGNTSGPDGVWTWQVNGGQEFDFAELYGTSNGFGDCGGMGTPTGFSWVSYSSGVPGNGNIPAGWAPTKYHKYGSLATTNGDNSRTQCAWIDDVFQSCQTSTNPSDNPNWLVIWVGGSGTNATQLPTTNLYVQYVRVWSCPSWQSSTCTGTKLVQQTENSTTLSYWK